MVLKDLTILIIFLQCTETKDDEKKPAGVGWPRYWWSAWVRPFWSAACGRHTAAWLTCTSLGGARAVRLVINWRGVLNR